MCLRCSTYWNGKLDTQREVKRKEKYILRERSCLEGLRIRQLLPSLFPTFFACPTTEPSPKNARRKRMEGKWKRNAYRWRRYWIKASWLNDELAFTYSLCTLWRSPLINQNSMLAFFSLLSSLKHLCSRPKKLNRLEFFPFLHFRRKQKHKRDYAQSVYYASHNRSYKIENTARNEYDIGVSELWWKATGSCHPCIYVQFQISVHAQLGLWRK